MASLQKIEQTTHSFISTLNGVSSNLEYQINYIERVKDIMKNNGWKGNTSTTFYSNIDTYISQMRTLLNEIGDFNQGVKDAFAKIQASFENAKNDNI